MSQWIIEIDTVEDEVLLQQVLPRFNSRFVQKVGADKPQEGVSKKEQLKDAFSKLCRSRVFEKYGDPSEWQREVRQDKSLVGRDV